MKKIYFICLFVLLLFLAYWAGFNLGSERAKRTAIETNSEQQIHVLKIQEKVNEEISSRGVSDIRDSLRKNYSITE